MELAEEAVEEVPLGCCMPVAGCAAALVVGSGAWGSGQGGQRPHVSGGAEPVILDESAADEFLLSRGSGDGRGAGVRLQGPGVGEAGFIVSDFCEDPGTELGADPGEAEQDLRVGVGEECFLDRGAELINGLAGGVEEEQQPDGLLADGVFDGLGLAGMITPKDGLDPLGLGGDAAGASRAAQRGFDSGGAQPGSCAAAWVRCAAVPWSRGG